LSGIDWGKEFACNLHLVFLFLPFISVQIIKCIYCFLFGLSHSMTNSLITFSFFLPFPPEMESAPRDIQVRPLSSSTMVITWQPPETPNGQVTVSMEQLPISRFVHFPSGPKNFCHYFDSFFSVSLIFSLTKK
jgi:hypothetical protein